MQISVCVFQNHSISILCVQIARLPVTELPTENCKVFSKIVIWRWRHCTMFFCMPRLQEDGVIFKPK